MENTTTEVFKHFLICKRFKAVAEILNADGHRTPNGAMLTGQAVSRTLMDRSHVDEGRVSEQLWDQCQQIIKAKKRTGSTRRVAHLCSGLLKCGCGQVMYVPTNSKKYVCSSCRNKIAIDDLEAIVLERLRQLGVSDIDWGLSMWPSLSFPERRELIEACVERILAKGKKVTVSLFAFG